MKKTICSLIIILFSITAINCGAIFENKPRARVDHWDKTISQNNRTKNNHNMVESRSPEKFVRVYKYIITAEGNIDSDDYLLDNPEDLLVKGVIPGEHGYLITVLSNDPIPHKDYFN